MNGGKRPGGVSHRGLHAPARQAARRCRGSCRIRFMPVSSCSRRATAGRAGAGVAHSGADRARRPPSSGPNDVSRIEVGPPEDARARTFAGDPAIRLVVRAVPGQRGRAVRGGADAGVRRASRRSTRFSFASRRRRRCALWVQLRAPVGNAERWGSDVLRRPESRIGRRSAVASSGRSARRRASTRRSTQVEFAAVRRGHVEYAAGHDRAA